MLYYPQLTTGAIAQFPIKKRLIRRTAKTFASGASSLKLADADLSLAEWDLTYTGLSDAELQSMQDLFSVTRGRLLTFLFLDPTDNLLAWSESLTKSAWTKDPLLTLSEGVEDHAGSTRAVRLSNAGGAVQSLSQTVNVPGWYRYCFSLFVRSEVEFAFTLGLTNADGQPSASFEAIPEWRRHFFSAAIAGLAEDLTVRLELPAGAALECFGLQVEAQPGASPYKKTGENGGVYPAARFAEDHLTHTTNIQNDHDLRVRVISRADR